MVNLATREGFQESTAKDEEQSFTFRDREVDQKPELVNLANYIEEEELGRISKVVFEDYEDDEESRAEWLGMQAEWVRLYYQKDKPKNPPWNGSSTESMPIVAEGCNQFHARAFKAFFSMPEFAKAVPIGEVQKKDIDRADRVGKFMTWQLEVQDRSYKRNKDRLLRALPLHGSVFTKVYRDPVNKRNVVENVRAIDMVLPYSAVGVNIEDIERKTHIIWMPLHKGKFLASQGYFMHNPQPYSDDDLNEAQRTFDDILGQREVNKGRGKAAKILEQHRYLDLDDDGIEEPYIVWLDATTKKVLRISIRYEVDEMGEPTHSKDPLEFFTHYVYFENPDGAYGLGIGHLTGSMNTSVNKMLRQVIDAATIQNARPGFLSKNVGIKKGHVEYTIGKLTTIDGITDDIRKGLMFMDHPGPSQTLVQALEAITARADRLNMVTDMLTGQPDKVYQPTTALAQIEQALTTFSAVQIRVYTALEQELSKLYRMNGLYLDERSYFTLLDNQGNLMMKNGQPQQQMIGRADFAQDLQIRPVFDPMHTTEEAKQQKAQSEMDFLANHPLLQQDQIRLRNASARYLETMGTKNIDEILPTVDEIKQNMQGQQQQQEMMQQMQQQMMDMQAQLEQQKVQIEAGKLEDKENQTEIARLKAQGDLVIRAKAQAEKERSNRTSEGLKEATSFTEARRVVADLEASIADRETNRTDKALEREREVNSLRNEKYEK